MEQNNTSINDAITTNNQILSNNQQSTINNVYTQSQQIYSNQSDYNDSQQTMEQHIQNSNNSTAPQKPENKFKKNYMGLIIGIVICVIVAIIAILFLVNYIAKLNSNTSNISNNDNSNLNVNNNADTDLKDNNANNTEQGNIEYNLKESYNITDKWQDLNIIIDGQLYTVGKSQFKEFINNNWEYNSNYIENQLNNENNNDLLKPNEEFIATIGNQSFGTIITATFVNHTSIEQKIEDCTLKTIIINLSSLKKDSYPDILIAGNISFSNTLQEAINKYNKASELIDKGDGYFSVHWYDTGSAFSYSKTMSLLVKEIKGEGILSSKILEITIESR